MFRCSMPTLTLLATLPLFVACPVDDDDDSATVSYTHLTLPTKA